MTEKKKMDNIDLRPEVKAEPSEKVVEIDPTKPVGESIDDSS